MYFIPPFGGSSLTWTVALAYSSSCYNLYVSVPCTLWSGHSSLRKTVLFISILSSKSSVIPICSKIKPRFLLVVSKLSTISATCFSHLYPVLYSTALPRPHLSSATVILSCPYCQRELSWLPAQPFISPQSKHFPSCSFVEMLPFPQGLGKRSHLSSISDQICHSLIHRFILLCFYPYYSTRDFYFRFYKIVLISRNLPCCQYFSRIGSECVLLMFV